MVRVPGVVPVVLRVVRADRVVRAVPARRAARGNNDATKVEAMKKPPAHTGDYQGTL